METLNKLGQRNLQLSFLKFFVFCFFVSILFFPIPSLASTALPLNLNMTTSTSAIIALMLFVIAYLLVMTEEFTVLRRSKPVVLAAGIIWALVAYTANSKGLVAEMNAAVKYNLLEYAELFLFLLVAMTYINALEERQIFAWLRSWLIRKGFTYHQLFWITGLLSFMISPIADNLTTALLMCAVVMKLGSGNRRFIALSCINIVVAANAGGAFSPFGDITTLMVWQKNILGVEHFLHLFIPSIVSYLIPAAIMHFALPPIKTLESSEIVTTKLGAKRIILLFVLTILTAVIFHHYLHLPPAIGMMTGFGYLKFFAYYIKKCEERMFNQQDPAAPKVRAFDIFRKVELVEWDTLMFFYGVMLCIGGLAAFGYLELSAGYLYNSLGNSLPAIHTATPANVMIGLLSAIFGNIPILFSVITMDPMMSEGQWLLVTLTAGIGGSIFSIGSAAGVALMGQARGKYTFFSHLKWSWAILLGYFAAVATHLILNADLFNRMPSL